MIYEELAYKKVKVAIQGWSDSICTDIYAISFFIYDEDDDPRKPTLTLGYNTKENWKNSIWEASSESEAKWNYAFWPQTVEAFIGDQNDAPLREKWIRSLGLWYSDQEEDDDLDGTLELGEAITRAFVELAIAVSQKLHSEGVVQGKFGRALPILVHESEYYNEIARQNERANPDGLASEFVAWIYEE